MADPLTIRFTIPQKPAPTADEVAEILGDTVIEAISHGDVFEVTYEPMSDDEEDSLWLMLCEIGVHYPGAVLAE